MKQAWKRIVLFYYFIKKVKLLAAVIEEISRSKHAFLPPVMVFFWLGMMEKRKNEPGNHYCNDKEYEDSCREEESDSIV